MNTTQNRETVTVTWLTWRPGTCKSQSQEGEREECRGALGRHGLLCSVQVKCQDMPGRGGGVT